MRWRPPALPLATLLSLAVAGLAAAGEPERFLEGRVVAVVDGDTIDVLVGSQPQRVRLAGIDTPERGQPWASRAKEALSERVFGLEVRINAVDTDRYGRTVGEVYANDVCVGCELVRAGHAWVYRQYSDDPVLLELERQARDARRGLWSLPESQRAPPWEWRSERRGERRGGPAAARAGAEALECGARSRCAEMTSCREARFHHEQCGLAHLDGDGDGVPCEALCGGR